MGYQMGYQIAIKWTIKTVFCYQESKIAIKIDEIAIKNNSRL
jgi:hypothetical protein